LKDLHNLFRHSEYKGAVVNALDGASRHLSRPLRFDYFGSVGKHLQELHPLAMSPPRVRSDRKGSRVRNYFIRDVSDLMADLTGKRLDEQVAVITEIAFERRDITVDMVRKARKVPLP
jgi:hypothetical protein